MFFLVDFEVMLDYFDRNTVQAKRFNTPVFCCLFKFSFFQLRRSIKFDF